MSVKRRLLLTRYFERAASLLRLLALVGIIYLVAMSFIGEIALPIEGNVLMYGSSTLLALLFFSKYPLEKLRAKNDFFINNFEDTVKYSNNKTKYGEYDQWGNLNTGLLLKRGSEHPVEELKDLIGLESVKKEVLKQKSVYEFDKAHHKNKDNPVRHLCFTGNPGTGKTTVACIFSGLLAQYKKIKYNMYLQCTGADLMGEYQGQTKSKIDAIFNLCRGGVLFIDEAYVLADAILTAITNNDVSSYREFPGADMPAGAAQLTCTNGTFSYLTPTNAFGSFAEAETIDPQKIAYPAELVYWDNSDLRHSSASKDASDYRFQFHCEKLFSGQM